jgi:hypothetical protein
MHLLADIVQSLDASLAEFCHQKQGDSRFQLELKKQINQVLFNPYVTGSR